MIYSDLVAWKTNHTEEIALRARAHYTRRTHYLQKEKRDETAYS